MVCGSTAGEEVPNLAAQSDNTSLVGTTTLTPTVVIEPALSRAVVQETVATKAPVQWEFSADLGEGDLVAIAGWTHRRGRDG